MFYTDQLKPTPLLDLDTRQAKPSHPTSAREDNMRHLHIQWHQEPPTKAPPKTKAPMTPDSELAIQAKLDADTREKLMRAAQGRMQTAAQSWSAPSVVGFPYNHPDVQKRLLEYAKLHNLGIGYDQYRQISALYKSGGDVGFQLLWRA